MMALLLIVAFGIFLILLPIAAAALSIEIGGLASGVLAIAGVLITVVGAAALIVTKLYVKASADMAFVRTGLGGLKVIQDGGALVIPVVHQVVQVPLITFRLEVERSNTDALITADKLRADVRAEFFIRVDPEEENIAQAARSLGDRLIDPGAVKMLVEDKLVSALRAVAATKTLEQLNSEREEFIKKVAENVTGDLQHNGFILEAPTLSALDQTDYSHLRENNIFDAQGMKTTTAITQAQMTERNEIARNNELARKEKDVQTHKAVLAQEQDEAEKVAEQDAAVKKAQAEQKQKAEKARIDAERVVELTAVDKAKALEVADVEKQQAEEVAGQRREAAVADAEREKALKRAEQAKAEALAEKERQGIKTVTVKETAEREKTEQVIAAEAEAETAYVEKQRRADADAYEVEKRANARKAAADADAEATIKKANAERDAEVARAEGLRANEMVPVDVQQRAVEVDRDRVETVLKPELEARERSGQVAQDFELDKLRIQAEKIVRVEMAKAAGEALSQVEFNAYGTPDQVSKMTEELFRGMGLAKKVEGFIDGTGPEAGALMLGAADKLGRVVSGLAAKAGIDISDDDEVVPASPELDGPVSMPESEVEADVAIDDDDIDDLPPEPEGLGDTDGDRDSGDPDATASDDDDPPRQRSSRWEDDES